MLKKYFCIIMLFSGAILFSCSKKNHPSATTASNDSLNVKKAVVKRKKEPVPKVITVSDSGAHKTVDGRYYYDLQGHRYWRNNKDGKYYLFNKSMYSNDDFKPTGN